MAGCAFARMFAGGRGRLFSLENFALQIFAKEIKILREHASFILWNSQLKSNLFRVDF